MSSLRDDRFSDEFLNAYLDGELDNQDRRHLMEAMRKNPGLRRRVQELSQVHDMVQYAYDDVPDNASHASERRHGEQERYSLKKKTIWSMAACLLAAVALTAGLTTYALHHYGKGPGIYPDQALAPQDEPWRVVLHVTTDKAHRLETILQETEAMLATYAEQGRPLQVHVLANGKGLELLRADKSPFADRIDRLQARYKNLVFQACNITLSRLQEELGKEIPLLPETNIVPSALGEVIKRQQQGWTYIKI